MGACLSSSCRASGSASSSSKLMTTIRLVHFNGYVEDFNPPLTVGEVMGKPPKHYVCTAAQLASVGFNPLPPQTQLDPGTVYFLLPLSLMQYEHSPLDMASIAKRLTAKAKSVPLSPKITPSPSVSIKSSSWFAGTVTNDETKESVPVSLDKITTASRGGSSTWKPALDAIAETSFAQSTESDLREMHFITSK